MNTMGRAGSELVPTLLTLGETLVIAKSHGWGMSSEDIEKLHEYHLQLLTIQTDWDHLVISMEKPIAAKIGVAIKWLEVASQNDVHAPPGVAQMAYQSFMSTVKRVVANSGPLGALAYSVGLLDDDKQTDMVGGAAVGGVPQRRCLVRTGMPFQQTDRRPRRGEANLLLDPRRRRVFFAPQILNGHRQIMRCHACAGSSE